MDFKLIEELMDGIRTREVRFPFIARIITEDMMSHFIVIYNLKGDKLTVGNPAKQHITEITVSNFAVGEIFKSCPNDFFGSCDFSKS